MNSQPSELKQRMSELNDATLLKIVEEDYANYRQEALDCAKQELAARGIAFAEPSDEELVEEVEETVFHPELVTVETYTSPYEAQIAKGMLETNGIPAFIANENFIGVNWLLSNAVGGVQLQVRENDAERAEELLDQEDDIALNAGEFAPSDGTILPDAAEVKMEKPGGKWRVKALAVAGLVILAFGGANFAIGYRPSPTFRPPLPYTTHTRGQDASEVVTLPYWIVLAQCKTVEAGHQSFDVLEIVTSQTYAPKTIRITTDKDGQVFNADGYAEKLSPGDKAVFFFYEELAEEQILKPQEFVSVFVEEAGGKKEQEVIQPFLNQRLFFADTGKPYKKNPQYVPLKDFLYSLKQEL